MAFKIATQSSVTLNFLWLPCNPSALTDISRTHLTHSSNETGQKVTLDEIMVFWVAGCVIVNEWDVKV
jgi:hypothetical protein